VDLTVADLDGLPRITAAAKEQRPSPPTWTL